MSALSIDKLKYAYDGNKVLNDITFKIKIPSMISIIGSNNCGKTTLIKCLSGVLPVDENIIIDDVVLNKKNIKKYSRSIGVVFSLDQNQFLFNKVLDEITFPLGNLNYSKKNMKSAVNEVSKLLEAKGASVVEFARFEKGEGIEKKEENFAEEVMKQLQ